MWPSGLYCEGMCAVISCRSDECIEGVGELGHLERKNCEIFHTA